MSSSIASFLSKYGIWIAMSGFFFGAGLLIYFIVGVVKTVNRARMFSVPLLEHQIIEFPEAREVILCGEGPRFTSRFARLNFVIKTEDGDLIDSHSTLFHATTSGISKVRVELRSFQIPRPGGYHFEIQKLGEIRPTDTKHQIVFMKPHLFTTVRYVIGILLSAMLLIGSIVLFFLSLLLQRSNV